MKNFYYLATILLLMLSGCGAEFIIGPIITGVIRWHDGEAKKYYNEDSVVVYRAALRTAQELNFEIKKNIPPDESGDSLITVDENDRLKIAIQQIESNITLVAIRVNLMGNRHYAELFYKKLDEQVNIIEFDESGLPR